MSRRRLSDQALPASVKKLRCAVYTRKSTEEGLDKEFNTLDAQRDACEAYVASQRAEGWILVRDRYGDGASRAAAWSGPRSGGCWPTSSGGWSTSSWSTRSTASAAR